MVLKKKWRLLSLITLIAMLVLSACGERRRKRRKADDTSYWSQDEEEITLKFVHWINEDVGKWEPVIEKYEAENPGIKIESIPLVDNMNNQDYYKQLDLMASAGEKIDLICFHNVNELVKKNRCWLSCTN